MDFQTQWQQKLEFVNRYFEQDLKQTGTNYDALFEAMAYSVKSGGKRIRPILLLSCFELFSDRWEEALPFCAAIEYIHTYSLIHDDLPCMDDDDLRRGNPTSHVKFGEGMAVLAGDALLNKAYEKIFFSSHPMALAAGKVISYFAGCNGMIAGQVIDIENEGKKLSLTVLEQLQELKTGALLRASCMAGAILGGAIREDIEVLGEFGRLLGLAFQIQDDILDVTSNSLKLGKPVGSDEKNKKTTYVSLLGMEQCTELNETLTHQAIEMLQCFGDQGKFLKQLALSLLKREK